MQAAGPVQATPLRPAGDPGVGGASTRHGRPFQAWAKSEPRFDVVVSWPTATQRAARAQDTEYKTTSPAAAAARARACVGGAGVAGAAAAVLAKAAASTAATVAILVAVIGRTIACLRTPGQTSSVCDQSNAPLTPFPCSRVG